MKNKKNMSYNNIDIGEIFAGVAIGAIIVFGVYKYIKIFVIGA